jgi:hypothetical protein
VAGEHADQHVGADAVTQAVPDGAQVQVVFADAEVLLDVGEVLAGGHGIGGGEFGPLNTVPLGVTVAAATASLRGRAACGSTRGVS